MRQALHDIAVALVVLLAIGLAVGVAQGAQAAPITERITMPTTYADGAPLPVASRVGASVYCGPTSGRYVQAWGVRGTDDVLEVTIDVRGRVFCANLVIAKASDGVGEVESDFGVEYIRTPNQPSVPLNSTSVRPTPLICPTGCTVDRRR